MNDKTDRGTYTSASQAAVRMLARQAGAQAAQNEHLHRPVERGATRTGVVAENVMKLATESETFTPRLMARSPISARTMTTAREHNE